MLTFEPLSIESIQRIKPFIKDKNLPFSDLSIGALFLWQIGAGARFSIWKNTLVLRQNMGGFPAFCYPYLGPDSCSGSGSGIHLCTD